MELNKTNILILGYFGYLNNQLDGQTIKTRTIYKLFENNLGDQYKIDYFDTQILKKSKLSVFSMLWKIIRCNKLIYIPAHNNLKYLFPIFYFICKFRKTKIYYFVVGGWLFEFINKHKYLIPLLSKIENIFVESHLLESSLIDKLAFNNSIYFPNFRFQEFSPSFERINPDELRVVFMARINRMKGFESMFKVAEFFADNQKIIIDFYGPIDESDENLFMKELKSHKNTRYMGILEPQDINRTLSGYDVMVLPTRYFTEGLPGSVMDSYLSGIPVIATKWKYAEEFIINNETGFIVPFQNGENEIIDSLLLLNNDRDKLSKMKINAHKKSYEFSATYAWNIIDKHFLKV